MPCGDVILQRDRSAAYPHGFTAYTIFERDEYIVRRFNLKRFHLKYPTFRARFLAEQRDFPVQACFRLRNAG